MLTELKYPGYFSLVLSSVCLVIQIVTLIKLIIQTWKKLPKLSIIIAWLSFIFFIGYNVYILIESIEIIINANTFNNYKCIRRFMSPWIHTTGEILMYLFYLNRLYKIFSETTFKYGRKGLTLFATFIVIGFYINIAIISYIILKNERQARLNGVINNISKVEDCILIIDLYDATNYKLFLGSILIAFIVETISAMILLRYTLLFFA